ncbi:Transcriptional activator spt7 [Irineochytrium annulatum]|nr:Transcriptional activator spt7 [Irineochytrium annulatum]
MKDPLSLPHSASSEAQPKVPFPQLAALRIRTMITEQMIPKVFPNAWSTALIDVHHDTDAILLSNSDGGVMEDYAQIGENLHEFIPIDDMFYSLENDVHAVEEIHKLRAERNNTELKHQQTPEIVKAHESRIGQEQLYDALEKVLNDLKNFTEHSEPFLQKVNKKDVPDYYDIIKSPMDLGTMSKKLSALAYNSKEEFSTDLFLIWSNCLIYNSSPESIYRKKAMAMKRKSTDLMRRVPDIKIEVKPIVEDPESESDGEDVPEAVEPPQVVGSRSFPSTSAMESTTGKKKRKLDLAENADTRKMAPKSIPPSVSAGLVENDMVDTATPKPVDVATPKPIEMEDRRLSISMMDKDDDAESDSVVLTGAAKKRPTKAPVQSQTQSDVAVVDVEPPEPPPEDPDDIAQAFCDAQTKKWDELTLQLRVESCIDRDIQMNLPFAERRALTPTPLQLKSFLDESMKFKQRIEVRREAFSQSVPTIESYIDEFFLPELSYTNSKYDFEPHGRSRLRTAINRNVNSLKKIKSVHGKILAKEDILELALQANGVESPDKLFTYIRFDVERYGLKLRDLQRRLESAYSELLQVTGQANNTDDMDLDDAEEQIISGNFFEDMGIDVLHLKELGIEISSVCVILAKTAAVTHKLRESAPAAHDSSQPKYKTTVPWKPVQPESVIGLLRAFYNKRAEEGTLLTEDADNPKTKTPAQKQLLKTALVGRKKTQQDMKAKQLDPQKAAEKAAKENAKRKREAEKAEKLKLKEEKKKKPKRAAAAAPQAPPTGNGQAS